MFLNYFMPLAYSTTSGYYSSGSRYAYFGFDWTYILVIIGMVLTLLAQAKVRSAFSKYSQVQTMLGLTGKEVAETILRNNGIYNVAVVSTKGNMTDHYDPRTNTVRLSETVYGKTSIAAVSVAAHECGHAIQHATGYGPLKLRSSMVPVVNVSSSISWIFIIAGLLIGNYGGKVILTIGIFLFSLAVLFQVVTLPVELNASKRALACLEGYGIMGSDEYPQAKKVLSAAAFTYVAAAASMVLQLLRLLLIANRRR